MPHCAARSNPTPSPSFPSLPASPTPLLPKMQTCSDPVPPPPTPSRPTPRLTPRGAAFSRHRPPCSTAARPAHLSPRSVWPCLPAPPHTVPSLSHLSPCPASLDLCPGLSQGRSLTCAVRPGGAALPGRRLARGAGNTSPRHAPAPGLQERVPGTRNTSPVEIQEQPGAAACQSITAVSQECELSINDSCQSRVRAVNHR